MLTIVILDQGATYEVRVKSVDQDVFFLVINDLKQRVPAYLRAYNATRRVWLIKRDAAHYLREWIEQARETFSATVEGDPGPWTKYRKPDWKSSYDYDAPPPPPRRPDWVDGEAGAFATLYLLPSAPAPLIKAAYKTLAQIHHPDKGGDASEMRKLNDAIETLKAKLAA